MAKTDNNMHFLLTTVNKGTSLVAACFDAINRAPADEQPGLAADFFVLYCSALSELGIRMPKLISESETKRYTLQFGDLVKAHMEELRKQELPDQEFYAQLWHYLHDDPVFPNEKARIVAMFICASDPQMPYFQLDKDKLVILEPEDYLETMNSLGSYRVAKLEHICRTSYGHHTEQASRLLQMLDELPDPKQRCVLMSRLLTCISLS